MTLEDQLQRNINEHLTSAGLDKSLPSFTEPEAIDFLTLAIQPDDAQHDFTNVREAAVILKAVIDFVRARKHVGIAFHRCHILN
ncbi:MAG: hypothetical protein ACQEXI_12335 [Pseudomonadota bacterium]